MGINTLLYEHEGRRGWGVVRDGAITPIPGDYATTGDFVRAMRVGELETLAGATLPESAVRVLSPVTRNQHFVCQGANYRQHMIESGLDPDDKNFNMIFTKASSCIVPADSDIIRPPVSRLLDYEVELGVVLGRDIDRAESVTSDTLHDYVAGVVIVNDVTARDIQVPQMQFYKGKSFRTFGPVGPYLCLLARADIVYLDDLELTLSVNGEIRQSDSTANLVYKPAETLSELSGVHDFTAGDLLSTGTPAGCALSVPSKAVQRVAALLPERTKWSLFLKTQSGRKQYLQPGDRIEARIRSRDGAIDLGVQRNRVVS
jgi:2,4-didehydro-3-deoxy-L-rhamnonate hydrolase